LFGFFNYCEKQVRNHSVTQSTTYLQQSKTFNCFNMPQKTSFPSKASGSAPRSPPKTRRSTRKRAQSSTDTTVEPPVKKVATGEVEEVGESRPKRGKVEKKGKGIRCVNSQFMITDHRLILLTGNLH